MKGAFWYWCTVVLAAALVIQGQYHRSEVRWRNQSIDQLTAMVDEWAAHCRVRAPQP